MKLFFSVLILCCPLIAKVTVGLDRFFDENIILEFKGKGVAVVTNHSAIRASGKNAVESFLQKKKEMNLKAFFAPEHGLFGLEHASERVGDITLAGLPVYSLHGRTRRPTDKMLEGIGVIIFDIQDIGIRSYTYASTLFYVMEEAAKRKIEVCVLDRPNPMGGELVDGPSLEDKWRSFVGYLDVPYCHGMTIGELARWFNAKYKVGCSLKVVEMKGWNRKMRFSDTELTWIPTSPNIPESDTPLYCATTGMIGELSLVNIGVGYTLPFKCLGAPWIDAELFNKVLNAHQLPGVEFHPIHYKPFFGSYKNKECHGIKITVKDTSVYKPIRTFYTLMATLKQLYPDKVVQKLKNSREDMFCKVNGTEATLKAFREQKVFLWSLIEKDASFCQRFCKEREQFLLY